MFICSNQSPSSMEICSASKALLQCVWKGGNPHFIFAVGNKNQELLIAHQQKIRTSVDVPLDFLYLFSSCTENHVCRTLGKMKVSTSLLLGKYKSSKRVEIEFILIGTCGDHTSETRNSHSSSASDQKIEGLSKKVVRFQPDELFSYCQCNSILGFTNYSEQEFYPNFELAAIIMKKNVSDTRHVAEIDGWGIKFLQEPYANCLDSSLEESDKKNRGESDSCMEIILPSGFHGGPSTKDGGPASLMERYKSGGHCDCGGWDVGCPVRVLRRAPSPAARATSSAQNEQILHLVVEGPRKAEPVLEMAKIDKRFYSVNFHHSLSALQSMAIAVAKIHSTLPRYTALRYKHKPF